MEARQVVEQQRKEAAIPVSAKPVAKAPRLMPDRIGDAEHKQHNWVVDAEPQITLENIQDPEFWAHVASQMEPFDHITVRRDDGKWIAYLIVVMCERNYAKVQLDRVIELLVNAEVPSGSVKNRIEFKGAHIKWCVVRNSDSQMLQQGLKSAAEASDWMRNFEKAQ